MKSYVTVIVYVLSWGRIIMSSRSYFVLLRFTWFNRGVNSLPWPWISNVYVCTNSKLTYYVYMERIQNCIRPWQKWTQFNIQQVIENVFLYFVWFVSKSIVFFTWMYVCCQDLSIFVLFVMTKTEFFEIWTLYSIKVPAYPPGHI